MKLRFGTGTPAEGAGDSAALENDARAASARDYWCRKFGDPELDEIVEEHRAWLDSRGENGRKAELAGANFEGADLMGAELRGANLLRANLRGADLLVADLRGACLIEADLSEANLVSTNLRGTTLAGANLATATGLIARQLGGASLIGTALPEAIYPFEGLAASARLCRILLILLSGMAVMCPFLWAVITATSDAALVKNAPAPIPLAGHLIPLLAFYLAAPIALASVYIAFHFYLQKLWDVMEELPSVFPDGRRLSECVAGPMVSLAPRGLRESEPKKRALAWMKRSVWQAIAYWMVPATLVLLWARYLVEQDWRGSLLQIFFILAASTMSGFLPRREESVFGAAEGAARPKKKVWESWHAGGLTAVTATGCLVLVVLSLGVILGAPRERSRAPALANGDFRRWPAIVFGVAGYDPFPNLSGARISDAPPGWSGSLSDVQTVKGARLANASLRYATADRALFARSELRNADLSGAQLADADFRVANLAAANLTATDLSRVDFRGADLRYVIATDAIASGARFDGASLYAANMTAARMDRASMLKCDMRGAGFENAELNQSDFSGAYMGSVRLAGARLEGARFDGAFMDAADMRDADLREAVFRGAILNGANLADATLEGADLRGALGLTVTQVCSAKSRRGAEMDDQLAAQVDAACGGK